MQSQLDKCTVVDICPLKNQEEYPPFGQKKMV